MLFKFIIVWAILASNTKHNMQGKGVFILKSRSECKFSQKTAKINFDDRRVLVNSYSVHSSLITLCQRYRIVSLHGCNLWHQQLTTLCFQCCFDIPFVL